MQVSLSTNGHEKTKETSKYKKLLISKRRIGILKNYLNKVKIVRVCDFIIFEIPNIIKSQTLTIFTLFR